MPASGGGNAWTLGLRTQGKAAIASLLLSGVAGLSDAASALPGQLAARLSDDRLAACGISPVAAAAAPDDGPGAVARQLLELAEFGDPSSGGFTLSPDGRQVALQLRQADIAGNCYRTRWIVGNLATERFTEILPGGAPQRPPDQRGIVVGPIPDPKMRWSPNGQWLALTRLDDDVPQLWRVRPDGSGAERLTDLPGGVADFAWEDEGEALVVAEDVAPAFVADMLHQEGLGGYLYDDRFVPTIAARPVAHFSPPLSTPSAWHCVRLEPPRVEACGRASFDRAHADSNRGGTHAARERLAAWAEPTDPTLDAALPVMTVRARGPSTRGRIRTCPDPRCMGQAIRSVWVRPDQDEVLFRADTGHALATSGLYAWDLRRDTVRTILETDDLLLGCTPAADGRLICARESSRQPRQLIMIDPAAGTVAVLYDPNPAFDGSELPRVARVTWTGATGAQGFADLVFPDDAAPSRTRGAVIVQYRSRGFLRGGVGNEIPVFALAKAGFLVVSFHRPDPLALSAQLDPEALQRALFEGASDRHRVLDLLEQGIAELEGRGLLHRARTCITGLSDGMQTTIFALIHSPPFACAIIGSPPFNPEMFYRAGPMLTRGAPALGLTYAGQQNRPFTQMNPALHVERMRTPLLMQLADEEYLAALTFHGLMRDCGRTVELRIFPGEHHVKMQPAHLFAVQRRAIDWIMFWLAGSEGTAPDLTGQFRRWRELRETSTGATGCALPLPARSSR